MTEYKLAPPKNIYSEEWVRSIDIHDENNRKWVEEKRKQLEKNNPFKNMFLDYLISLGNEKA